MKFTNALNLSASAALLLLLLVSGGTAFVSAEGGGGGGDKPAALQTSGNNGFFAFGPPALTGMAAAALTAPNNTVTGALVNKVDTLLSAKYDPETVAAWRRLVTGQAAIDAVAGPALSGDIQCFVGPSGTVVGLKYGSAQVCETSPNVVDIKIGTGFVSNVKVILATPNATVGGLEFVVTTGKTSQSTFCGRALGLSAWIGKPGQAVGAIGGTCSAPVVAARRRRRGRSMLEEEEEGEKLKKEEEEKAAAEGTTPEQEEGGEKLKREEEEKAAAEGKPEQEQPEPAAAADEASAKPEGSSGPLPPPSLLPPPQQQQEQQQQQQQPPPRPPPRRRNHPHHHDKDDEEAEAAAAAVASPALAPAAPDVVVALSPAAAAAQPSLSRRSLLQAPTNGTKGGLSAGTLQVVLVPAPEGENDSGAYGNGTIFGG